MAKTDSTAVEIVEQEGRSMIVFHAPNDGSISEIIDPSFKVENGRLEYDERHYHIVDPSGYTHLITMIGTEKLNQIFAFLNREIAKITHEVDSLDKRIQQATDQIAEYKKRLFLYKQQQDKVDLLEEENKKYREMIGAFDTPMLILRELYKNGQINHGRLIPPTQFKHPQLLYKEKKNRAYITYWVSLFEQWEIIDNYSSRYLLAIPTFKEAKKILLDKLGEIK